MENQLLSPTSATATSCFANSSLLPSTSSNSSRVHVSIRIRPLSAIEKSTGHRSCIQEYGGKLLTIKKAGEINQYLKSQQNSLSEYQFDNVFNENICQIDIYNNTLKNFLFKLFQGEDVTVFAYGATGAGKTYTMMGNLTDSIPQSDLLSTENNNLSSTITSTPNPPLSIINPSEIINHDGIIQNALYDIFLEYNKQKESIKNSQINELIDNKNSELTSIEIGLSFLEVYNEQIFDLLDNLGRSLSIREDQTINKIVVSGLTQKIITNVDEALELIRYGIKNRKTEATFANSVSSRSHAIIQLYLRKTYSSYTNLNNTTSNLFSQKINTTIESKLSLIDLAGSERACATGNTGVRFQEGANINKSLLALGNCINALAENSNNENKDKEKENQLSSTPMNQNLSTGERNSMLISSFSTNSLLTPLNNNCASFLTPQPQPSNASSLFNSTGAATTLSVTSTISTNNNNNSSTSKKINVKYRDSKLTLLLKTSLEGNCNLIMIANINPSHFTYEDSHNTLKYANRAKNIKINPTLKNIAKESSIVYNNSNDNNINSDKEIKLLKDEINFLNNELRKLKDFQRKALLLYPDLHKHLPKDNSEVTETANQVENEDINSDVINTNNSLNLLANSKIPLPGSSFTNSSSLTIEIPNPFSLTTPIKTYSTDPENYDEIDSTPIKKTRVISKCNCPNSELCICNQSSKSLTTSSSTSSLIYSISSETISPSNENSSSSKNEPPITLGNSASTSALQSRKRRASYLPIPSSVYKKNLSSKSSTTYKPITFDLDAASPLKNDKHDIALTIDTSDASSISSSSNNSNRSNSSQFFANSNNCTNSSSRFKDSSIKSPFKSPINSQLKSLNSPLKSPINSPLKLSSNSPKKSPNKSLIKTPLNKTPLTKTPLSKTPVKTPIKTPAKTPIKTQLSNQNTSNSLATTIPASVKITPSKVIAKTPTKSPTDCSLKTPLKTQIKVPIRDFSLSPNASPMNKNMILNSNENKYSESSHLTPSSTSKIIGRLSGSFNVRDLTNNQFSTSNSPNLNKVKAFSHSPISSFSPLSNDNNQINDNNKIAISSSSSAVSNSTTQIKSRRESLSHINQLLDNLSNLTASLSESKVNKTLKKKKKIV